MLKAALLLAAVLLAGCGGEPLDRLAEGERGRVAEVFSGGELRLEDGLTVRLAGVEVPGADDPGGPQAEAALNRLLLGREVFLLYGGERRDGFGRASAHLRTAGARRWAQGALLGAGLARVRTSPEDRALAAEMLAREAGARSRRRGSWADPAWRVLLPHEVRPGFMLVEGQVSGVERTRRGWRLRFRSAGRSLSADVPWRAASDFAAAHRPLPELHGGLVRIRGVARDVAGGAVIVLDHPEQVEVLRNRQR